MPYRWGDVPQRDIVARTEFERENPEKTKEERKLARTLAIATYDHNPAELEQLRAKIENEVTGLVGAKSFADAEAQWDAYRLTPTEIYRSLMISSGGLTHRLGRLEAAGLVARDPSAEDGRSLAVRLTEEGRRRVEAAFRADMTRIIRRLNPLTSR